MRAASKENASRTHSGGESSSDESQSIASVMRFAADPFRLRYQASIVPSQEES